MKKTLLIIALAVVVLGALGFLGYKFLLQNPKGEVQNNTFTLNYEYQGNNKWTYTVAGTLPTPCYDVTTDAVVMESYPEQVKVTVKTQEQSDGYVCATVIKDYSYTGTFNASKNAKITLDIE